MRKIGTLSIADMLRVRNASLIEYDLDEIAETVRRDLDVHNTLATQAVADLAEVTADRQRAVGTSETGDMIDADEFTRAPTQKVAPGATLGIPMRLAQYAIGWTRKFFEQKTPADLAIQVISAQKAHRKAIIRQLKRAFYISANYTVRDYLVDNIDLAVKRFLNADGMGIPEGPNGETFNAATHTHYSFNNGLSAAAATAIVQNVVEHGHGTVRIVIARADEAAWRALTGFTPYLDARIVAPTTAASVGAPRLDTSRLDNRAIGIYEGAEVWVKPWAIANYAFAHAINGETKPLALRTRTGEGTNLRVAAEIRLEPLQAQYMEDEFDAAVVDRTAGAVLYHAAGAVAYVDPTIT